MKESEERERGKKKKGERSNSLTLANSRFTCKLNGGWRKISQCSCSVRRVKGERGKATRATNVSGHRVKVKVIAIEIAGGKENTASEESPHGESVQLCFRGQEREREREKEREREHFITCTGTQCT